MNITTSTGDVLQTSSGLAILLGFEGDALPDAVAGLIESSDFSGKANKTALVYPKGAVAPTRLLLVGLGTRDGVNAEAIRQAAATAIRQARTYQVASVTVGFAGDLPLAAGATGEALVEGLEMGAYRYLQHRTGLSADESFEIADVTILAAASVDELAAGATTGSIIAGGVLLARDLVNRPGELKTPPLLADEAVALGQRVDGVTVTVFDEVRLAEEGFGGILAVGKASDAKPRFIIFEYGADLKDVPTICLVGKGLTFDCGGLNIKGADGMESMKNDMGGSAAVFGAMQVVAQLGLPLHVVGLVPSAENMISGNAYRPGDIITTLSGKTIEILNTDAEGRVILSDGLFYAQRYQPDAIINLATLTGAVIVALGSIASGLMATNQPLADKVKAAGDTTNDLVWQLPLSGDYLTLSNSDIADLKNHVGRSAGSVGAAAFLAAFVGDYPFAHLDIAGTAWLDAPKKPYHSKGGTGSGVRLLVEYLRNHAA